MIGTFVRLAILAFVAAAICVPIVLVMHHSLMPSSAELSQIDAAVQSVAPSGSVLHRLRAPDRVGVEGHEKVGYFTYEVVGAKPPAQYHADWRIKDGKVEITSFKPL